jgi:hypothetical protein
LDELGGAELEPEPEAIGPELELEPIGAIDPERIVTSRRLDGQDVPGGSWTSLEMLIGRAKVYEQANKRTSKHKHQARFQQHGKRSPSRACIESKMRS